MKESRNRDNNTKKTEYILNERCKFVKKRSSEILERIEENFFKIFCLKIHFPKIFAPPIFVTQIFAPPIFMTSLRRWIRMHKKPKFNGNPRISSLPNTFMVASRCIAYHINRQEKYSVYGLIFALSFLHRLHSFRS